MIKKFNEKYADYYYQIKFQDYNTDDYNHTTLKIIQINAYNKLKEIDGVHPYFLDNSSEYHEERKLYAIIMDNDNIEEIENSIIKVGKSLKIAVEPKTQISPDFIDDVVNKRLYNYYDVNFKDVISYDFDGVLHTSVIKGTIHPIDYDNYRKWKPNYEIIEQLIEQMENGHTIIVVTSRTMMDIPTIWSFLNAWGIPIDEVFTTESDYIKKSYILKSLNAIEHYDDNILIKNDVESVGTKFIFVQN